jgi:hypothetical protein
MTENQQDAPKVLPPLNRFQINYAREIIENNHPLRGAHITQALPCLKPVRCCLKKRKRSFKVALKKSLRHKLDMKMPNSELLIEEDPFLLMGFGMNAYFGIVAQLTAMFCWITLFSIPLMYIYSSYNGLATAVYYPLDMWSLGNMGGSSVQCGSVPQTVDSAALTLTCPSGSFDTTALAHSDSQPVLRYGIINSSTDVKTYCSYENYDDPYNCRQWIDGNELEDALDSQNGQTTFTVAGFGPTDPAYRAYSFSNPIPDDIKAECFEGSSQFFVQMACTIPEAELTTRKVQGLLIASITIAIALYVSVFTDYIRQVAKNNFVEWDVNTVTAADYSIEFDLTDTSTAEGGDKVHFYDRFIELHGHRKPENLPMATYFRDWLQNEME